MAGHDALSKRFLQRLDWIALAKTAERRSKLLRAVSGSTDCMTRSAVAGKQRFTAFQILRVSDPANVMNAMVAASNPLRIKPPAANPACRM